MLANSVKLDAFEKVKADEIKHKDFCVEEFNTADLQEKGLEVLMLASPSASSLTLALKSRR